MHLIYPGLGSSLCLCVGSSEYSDYTRSVLRCWISFDEKLIEGQNWRYRSLVCSVRARISSLCPSSLQIIADCCVLVAGTLSQRYAKTSSITGWQTRNPFNGQYKNVHCACDGWPYAHDVMTWYVFVRASSMIWGERPTRCYTIVYWTYDSLNMFRAPLCPSSGAGDYTDIHSMWHITLVVAGCRWGLWL